MKTVILLVSLVPLLSACLGDSLIMTGQKSEAVDSESVRLLFGYRTDCPHSAIATIEISGGHFSRESIVQEFRDRAANLGADVVQITYLQKRDVGEFLGQARALRCDNRTTTDQSSESGLSSSSS